MADFTANWDWPQWAIVVWLFLGFLIVAPEHGKPMLETTGDEAGKPKRHNTFVFATRVAFLLFVLIAGGFFA